eukprot:gnl/MRDRNA2_/MRDRNA2_73507_c0_seq2.p1 gnl/MRDRNA2_/MRDRNA2_73507_c0~~gnl/MRDRNA2_/MRDRNA2_73507_c0_seq2.p1  ORF type:complete len:596 (-),score=127.19 gnl/MRDRNA2_/MRDRNA2_73507_c0_seq2:30-1817(-)
MVEEIGTDDQTRKTKKLKTDSSEAGIQKEAPDVDFISFGGTERQKGKGKGKGKGKVAEPKFRKSKFDVKKYERGSTEKVKGIEDKKLKTKLKRADKRDREAAFLAAKGEILNPAEAGFLEAEGRERTYKFSQAAIKKEIAVGVAKKLFDFTVPYGPYYCSYSSNGRHLLIGGRKGQFALMECDTMQLVGEIQLKETIRAVQVCHNFQFLAAAQKKYTYIYDQFGVELHCLRDLKYQTCLEYLPYHWLLVSAGDFADLNYRDMSTGQPVVRHKTKLGPTICMRQNRHNALIHCGHSNGTVTMWTPNLGQPVVKMLCHHGHVTALGVHKNHMATCGSDGKWKVYDIRKLEPMHTFSYHGAPPSDLDLSMTGLVSVGFGSHLQIWKDAFIAAKPKMPYMTQEYPGSQVSCTRFRPFEDVCTIGSSGGFHSIVVPGAGFANFDSFEDNPFETKKQRREKEVRSLLEKLQPSTIMVDPGLIGSVNPEVAQAEKRRVEKEMADEKATKKKKKRRMRGHSKVGKRLKRKSQADAMQQKEKTRTRLKDEKAEAGDEDDDDAEDADFDDGPDLENKVDSSSQQKPASRAQGALTRFFKKKAKRI